MLYNAMAIIVNLSLAEKLPTSSTPTPQTHTHPTLTYSTSRVYVNRKTRIKRAKNRMQLRIKKIVRVKKSHVRARL